LRSSGVGAVGYIQERYDRKKDPPLSMQEESLIDYNIVPTINNLFSFIIIDATAYLISPSSFLLLVVTKQDDDWLLEYETSSRLRLHHHDADGQHQRHDAVSFFDHSSA